MLKSEAEQMVQRAVEETGATFTPEQTEALAIAILKIAGRLMEEALATFKPGVPGSKPNFYS
ncbi:MAG: hypothetical protein K2Y22_06925 [Candidatus Obscuribacterales bacterium]|nr:hypothetical protein [Candidatus Obscuribacterales bacterium]